MNIPRLLIPVLFSASFVQPQVEATPVEVINQAPIETQIVNDPLVTEISNFSDRAGNR